MELNIRGAKHIRGVDRVHLNAEGELDIHLQHGEQIIANGVTLRSQDKGITVEVSENRWILLEPEGEFTFGGSFLECELMGDSDTTRVDFKNNGWQVIVLLTEGKAFITFE